MHFDVYDVLAVLNVLPWIFQLCSLQLAAGDRLPVLNVVGCLMLSNYSQCVGCLMCSNCSKCSLLSGPQLFPMQFVAYGFLTIPNVVGSIGFHNYYRCI